MLNLFCLNITFPTKLSLVLFNILKHVYLFSNLILYVNVHYDWKPSLFNIGGTYYIYIVVLPLNYLFLGSAHLDKHDGLTCVGTR